MQLARQVFGHEPSVKSQRITIVFLCEPDFMVTHRTVVEVFLSGPKWWTHETNTIPKAQQLTELAWL